MSGISSLIGPFVCRSHRLQKGIGTSFVVVKKITNNSNNSNGDTKESKIPLMEVKEYNIFFYILILYN